MPRRVFSLFGPPAQERIAQTTTEREEAANRLFRRTTFWVSLLSVAVALAIHFFISKEWTIALGFGLAGPALSAIGYAIERVLEAHTDSLMESKFASLDRDFKAIPVVVRGAVAQDVDDIKNSMQFISSYLECTGDDDVDPYNRAPWILRELQDKMHDLVEGSFDLEGDDYYKWLGDRLILRKSSKVRAISHRRVTNYRSDSRERTFLQQNIDAITSGTEITRIFVLSSDALESDATWTELLNDFVSTGMDVFFVFEDELAPATTLWLMGGGLSIYDEEEVAFYDRSFLESPPVEAMDQQHALVPKATIYLNRHPSCARLGKIFNAVFEAATRSSGDANDNYERFQVLHERYLERLSARGLGDSDESVAVVKRSRDALDAAKASASMQSAPAGFGSIENHMPPGDGGGSAPAHAASTPTLSGESAGGQASVPSDHSEGPVVPAENRAAAVATAEPGNGKVDVAAAGLRHAVAPPVEDS